MYDPTTARFLSKDPLEEAGGSPNPYLYCANDPVNRTDPSGNIFPCIGPQRVCDSINRTIGYDPNRGRQRVQEAGQRARQVVRPIQQRAAQVVQRPIAVADRIAGAAQDQLNRLRDDIADALPPSVLALAGQVGDCARSVYNGDAISLAERILTWGFKSVGAFANIAEPVLWLSRVDPDKASLDEVDGAVNTIQKNRAVLRGLPPRIPLHAIRDFADNACARLLPGHATLLSALGTRQDFDNAVELADYIWDVATDDPHPGATLLKMIQESPFIKKMKASIPAAGSALLQTIEIALDEGVKPSAQNAFSVLDHVARGFHPDSDKLLDVFSQAIDRIPEDLKIDWEHFSIYEDVVEDLRAYGLAALDDAVDQLSAFVNGPDFWDTLYKTVIVQIWPFGPPAHKEGVINDVLATVPLLRSAGGHLWGGATLTVSPESVR